MAYLRTGQLGTQRRLSYVPSITFHHDMGSRYYFLNYTQIYAESIEEPVEAQIIDLAEVPAANQVVDRVEEQVANQIVNRVEVQIQNRPQDLFPNRLGQYRIYLKEKANE